MSSNERRGLRGFADRWPFRRKLNVLVGVPLAGVAVLLSYLIADQVQQARDAAESAQLVRDSIQVAELVDRVATEHQQAILLSVRYEAAGPGTRPSTDGYRDAQKAVDAQVEKVRDAFGDRLPATEAQALREISGLDSLRATIAQGYLPADNIDPAYMGATKGLIDGLGLDRTAPLATTYTGNLLDSLLRADAAHSAFETSVFSATTGDSNALIEFISAVGSYDVYTHQAERFARFASEEQTAELRGIEHSAAQATIVRQYAELQIDPSGLQAGTPDEIREKFTSALASYPAYRQQAQTRLEITASLIDQIADRADGASGEAWWNAGWLLGSAVFGFMVWLAFSVVVRRSVVRPVQALTGAARQVAEVAGRELARVADDDTEDDAPPRLREVPVTARDEIGDLADAFNHVQTTAAALLERQVLSRRNVAEMFGNVGRRVSNLTTRQLALIDAVERGETDPALLERLYRIDHIAVRLRRNADSLMLLAGIRETVLGSGPVELTNVVRAALGQIEGYQRVELHAGAEIMVEPDIVGDLTLMVAELMENAVSFSPADSPVEVTVRAGGAADGGATITISDHGLGMSPERLAEENARLIRRERLDLVPTKVLGLFVVGTLARRWEIGVSLSRTRGGGVTAEVAIPASLLLVVTTEVGVPAGGVETRAVTGTGTEDTEDGAVVGSRTGTASTGTGEATPADAAPEPTGPTPTATAPPPGDDTPDPLPRRVPRRDPAPVAEAPFIPKARDGEPAPSGGARPLRRRVKGATLRTTSSEAERQALLKATPPADADAVRDALEEFEAAVAQAHRDSDTGSHPAPQRHDSPERTRDSRTPDLGQDSLPEGAEQ
ncbi:ATP-binding protein [Streptomyces sp. NPDC057877]|uniref:sensor histidine kinase n=1 Tax=Streptomyces sp. NPDC057877 TaxID=3346269 RepID=UPI0036D1FA73